MKLTDSQLVMLNSATQRADGALLPLPKTMKLNAGAAALVMKSLLKHKLVEETIAQPDVDAWRQEKDGRRFALVVTAAGLKAIGVEALPEGKGAGGKGRADPRKVETKHTNAMQRSDKHKGTKLSVLVDLLSRKSGATIEEAAKATGWQHHSVRGAISGTLKKKMGLTIDSTVEKRGRVYRVDGSPS